ncbi:TPA: hypothetical protein ACH3X1_008648 [Trebouxia sp. C0004]
MDGQKRTTSASPTASLTQLEGPVPAADRGLTPPPPPGLARTSGTASPSSKITGRILPLPFASGGFGFTLRPEMLRRLGNRDGNPFGQQASGSDRGQGADRLVNTSRPRLRNIVQTPPSSQGSSGSGGSIRSRGRGRHATEGGCFCGGQQQ